MNTGPALNRRWLVASVLLVIAAACFWQLGSIPLYETDEGFAATRADSFYRHHTWRLSFDDVGEDGPQFRKPPLLYWCVASLFQILGRTLWAVRLPTALAGFLCALLTWRLARRFVDEATGLAAALLLVTIPFVLLHIRTAMLEMPLVFLTLAGACSFAFLPRRAQRVAGAGLAAGAAVLLKGGAGAYVLVIPLVFGVLYRRCRPAALLEVPFVALTAILLPLAYFAVVPADYRATMVHRLFVEEASERIRVFSHVFARMPAAIEVLTNTLAWHVPAAIGGFLLLAAGIRRHNAWDRIAFLSLVILAALPLLWVYASMVHPFPRYLLPLYPLLLILSAAFAREALASRWPILWLAPFAVAAATGSASPLRWVPAGVAAVIAIATVRLPHRTRPDAPPPAPAVRTLLAFTLLAAIAIPSALAPSARTYHPGPDRGPRPDLVPLALRLQHLVPATEKVVVEERIKCHTILFYGRRSIDSFEEWLLGTATPGQSRYGIFQHMPPGRVPGLAIEEVQASGSWRLLKLTVLPSTNQWAGILFAKEASRASMAAMLDYMNITRESFDNGFLLRHIPDAKPLPVQPVLTLATAEAPGTATPVPADPFRVEAGGTLTLTWPTPVSCSGFDIIAAGKREPLEGWRVEYRHHGDDEWTRLRTVENPFTSTLDIRAGRLEKTSTRGLRLRFEPVLATQWRLVRTSAAPVKLNRLTCLGGA